MGARLIAAGLLLAALAGAWWYVEALRGDLAASQLEVAGLKGQLAEQNRLVARWSSTQEEAMRQAARARYAARLDIRAQQAVVDALQARILASAGATCNQAIAEIREQLR